MDDDEFSFFYSLSRVSANGVLPVGGVDTPSMKVMKTIKKWQSNYTFTENDPGAVRKINSQQ
jgi:hypothetical protein